MKLYSSILSSKLQINISNVQKVNSYGFISFHTDIFELSAPKLDWQYEKVTMFIFRKLAVPSHFGNWPYLHREKEMLRCLEEVWMGRRRLVLWGSRRRSLGASARRLLQVGSLPNPLVHLQYQRTFAFTVSTSASTLPDNICVNRFFARVSTMPAYYSSIYGQLVPLQFLLVQHLPRLYYILGLQP